MDGLREDIGSAWRGRKVRLSGCNVSKPAAASTSVRCRLSRFRATAGKRRGRRRPSDQAEGGLAGGATAPGRDSRRAMIFW